MLIYQFNWSYAYERIWLKQVFLRACELKLNSFYDKNYPKSLELGNFETNSIG